MIYEVFLCNLDRSMWRSSHFIDDLGNSNMAAIFQDGGKIPKQEVWGYSVIWNEKYLRNLDLSMWRSSLFMDDLDNSNMAAIISKMAENSKTESRRVFGYMKWRRVLNFKSLASVIYFLQPFI